jgi:hypothetical protein
MQFRSHSECEAPMASCGDSLICACWVKLIVVVVSRRDGRVECLQTTRFADHALISSAFHPSPIIIPRSAKPNSQPRHITYPRFPKSPPAYEVHLRTMRQPRGGVSNNRLDSGQQVSHVLAWWKATTATGWGLRSSGWRRWRRWR